MGGEQVAGLRAWLVPYGRVWRLLPRHWRFRAGLLFAGNLVGAALEVLALWSLATLIASLTPGAGFAGSATAAFQARWSPPGLSLPLALVVLTALVFVAKNVFLAVLAWGEATFAFALQTQLADAALTGILGSDYASVARKAPSAHLNLLTSELILIVTQLVVPSLTVVSELVMMGGVVAFLFWREPVLTGAVVLAVGGAGALLVAWGRNYTMALGRRRQLLEDDRMRRLRETFLHLREVYVYRAGRHAHAQLQAGMGEISRVFRAYQLLLTGPRFILELVLMAVLLVAIVAGLHRDGGQTVIVSVGLFAAAGFRLLVGANRVIVCSQAIRFGAPALRRLLDAVDAAQAIPGGPDARDARIRVPQVLAVRGVQYRYPDAGARVLDGVDLELRPGTTIGIRGGSGGGKTTLLEIIAGLRRPDAGELLLDGVPVRDPARELLHVVGYVGQSAAVFSESVRRNVAFGQDDGDIDDARVWNALERARLADFVRGLPGGLDHVFGGATPQLSGGQAQRLALARALYADCLFVLLDEPTSALDAATEHDVTATLGELGADRGILLVSHREGPLALCGAVYEMRAGRLVAA